MIGFLFAGQGSQYVGMGKDFYENYEIAKNVYDSIQMDFDVKDVCFNGPQERLNDTAYTQSCIVATSLAIAQCLKENGVQPDYVAGLSLGEYSALAFANAISMKDVLPLVRSRGNIMADALRDSETMMMAVMRPDIDRILEVCKAVPDMYVANYNSPKQVVVSGSCHACDIAKAMLEQHGMRTIPLKVSGAFHSPYLYDGSQQFKSVLEQVSFQPMDIPVVFNVSAQEESGDLVPILTKQMCNSVRFQQSIEYMIDKGVDTFIEIGPGKVLGKLVSQINKNVKVVSIDTVKDLEEFLHDK